MSRHINVGRNGAFNGLFGNPVREKTVSPGYRLHIRRVMRNNPKETAWLREQVAAGVQLFCPGCGFDCPTCHARILEQELAFCFDL